MWGCPSLVKVVGPPTTRGRAGEAVEQRSGAVWGCQGVKQGGLGLGGVVFSVRPEVRRTDGEVCGAARH